MYTFTILLDYHIFYYLIFTIKVREGLKDGDPIGNESPRTYRKVSISSEYVPIQRDNGNVFTFEHKCNKTRCNKDDCRTETLLNHSQVSLDDVR